MKVMEKIPKGFKRWLKNNGRYNEFIRLISLCDYTAQELSLEKKLANGHYYIEDWFKIPIVERTVSYKNKLIKYTDFLDKFNLNWK